MQGLRAVRLLLALPLLLATHLSATGTSATGAVMQATGMQDSAHGLVQSLRPDYMPRRAVFLETATATQQSGWEQPQLASFVGSSPSASMPREEDAAHKSMGSVPPGPATGGVASTPLHSLPIVPPVAMGRGQDMSLSEGLAPTPQPVAPVAAGAGEHLGEVAAHEEGEVHAQPLAPVARALAAQDVAPRTGGAATTGFVGSKQGQEGGRAPPLDPMGEQAIASKDRARVPVLEQPRDARTGSAAPAPPAAAAWAGAGGGAGAGGEARAQRGEDVAQASPHAGATRLRSLERGWGLGVGV